MEEMAWELCYFGKSESQVITAVWVKYLESLLDVLAWTMLPMDVVYVDVTSWGYRIIANNSVCGVKICNKAWSIINRLPCRRLKRSWRLFQKNQRKRAQNSTQWIRIAASTDHRRHHYLVNYKTHYPLWFAALQKDQTKGQWGRYETKHLTSFGRL